MGNLSTRNSRGTEDLPTSLYVWEIKSFSSLLKSGDKKYESGPFEVGGHFWKLVMYPSHHREKNNGSMVYISLYLKICESGFIENGGTVAANFKLFVFNQRTTKHLTRKMSHSDVDGGMTHFNRNRIMHGFEQMISLKDFQKKSCGYLSNDRCAFGAVIFVKPTVRKEILSVIKNPRIQILKFTKFSTLNDRQFSEKFIIDGYKWQVILYPNGKGEEKNKSLSIFLKLCDDNYSEKFYAKFKLRVRGNPSTFEKQGTSWSSKQAVGFDGFMPLQYLKERKNGYIEKDALIVEVEILQFSVVLAVKKP